jgi:hypothetical protein
VFRAVAARGDRVAKWRLHSKRPSGYRTTFAVESPTVLDTERLLLWSRHFATLSPLAAVARNTFPRKLQTDFENFPNNYCISRDCRLYGYFITNMWKCYLLFELPCIIVGYKLLVKESYKIGSNSSSVVRVLWRALRRSGTQNGPSSGLSAWGYWSCPS